MNRLPVTAILAAMVLVMAGACSPTLNWRTVQPRDGVVVALFPCKPDQMVRQVSLAGGVVSMGMASCSAGGATFAITQADVDQPARVSPAMLQLKSSMGENFGAAPEVVSNYAVRGMTPHPMAERVRVAGRRPGGEPLAAQAVFFVSGTRVHQASVVGVASQEALDTFFSNLSVPR